MINDNELPNELPNHDVFSDITRQQQEITDAAQQEYNQIRLSKKLNNYYKLKPYYIQKKVPYSVARIMALIGHLFSIIIGMYLALKIGGFLFSWLDTVVYKWITVGSLVGALAGLSGLVLWEVLKSYKFRSFFKNKLQFPNFRARKHIWKLAIILLISMAFNGYGGFESVRISYGEAVIAEAPAVDIEAKVSHIRAGIAQKDSTLANWEKAQAARVADGEQRMYKMEKAILSLQAQRNSQDSLLNAKLDHWEDHNEKAGGKTKTDNDVITASHNRDKAYYSILSALIALVFDVLVISCIFYCEHYKHTSHNQLTKTKKPVVNNVINSHNVDVIAKKQAPVNNNEEITEPVIEDVILDNNTEVEQVDEYNFVMDWNDGVPFTIVQGKPFTLAAAKQRRAIASSRLSPDRNGTNAANFKLFDAAVDFLTPKPKTTSK